jgi:hypothetical protein
MLEFDYSEHRCTQREEGGRGRVNIGPARQTSKHLLIKME